ncbi:MAG: CBS domain-containing protein, partial [Gammaproteobacteria bacterium]|nr:CBS domain-containing protein [Gammaproteobacteria bacterium]
KDITVVYPDSPLMDALLLLYHKFIRIPVIERDSRRLVGGVSFITVLRALELEQTIARQHDGE